MNTDNNTAQQRRNKRRSRPGKSQRANTVAKAVRIVQAAKVTANQAMLAVEKSKPKDYASRMVKASGPQASRGGSSRERLKGGSYGVGFQGPRGFHSPKDHLSKAERTPGALTPRQALRITAEASKRFALDGYEDDRPGPSVARVKRQRERHWRTLGKV